MYNAHDVVVVALVERESGVSGGARQLDDIADGCGVFEHGDLASRGHDLGGGQLGEAQGTVQEAGYSGVEGAFLGGSAHHRGELVGGAGGGEFFLGFHAESVQNPVCGTVHNAYERRNNAGKVQLEGGKTAGHGVGVRDSESLGQQFAHHHG